MLFVANRNDSPPPKQKPPFGVASRYLYILFAAAAESRVGPGRSY